VQITALVSVFILRQDTSEMYRRALKTVLDLEREHSMRRDACMITCEGEAISPSTERSE
jgi:hypothetical protein